MQRVTLCPWDLAGTAGGWMIVGGGADGFRKSGVTDVGDAPIDVVGFALIHARAQRHHRRQQHPRTYRMRQAAAAAAAQEEGSV
jgi:hypothetical protein